MEIEMKRRTFLKLSTAAIAAGVTASSFKDVDAAEWKKEIGKKGSQPDPVDEEVKLIRSVCLMCHGGCGIQAKVAKGELVKLDGNPYHPNNYDYAAKGDIVVESDLDAGHAGKDRGTLCPKGNAGVYSLYSPFRLQHPLKRAGARGSGKWKVISWNQAIKEICGGGKLFKDVKGEENRNVEGLKSVLNNENPIGPEDSAYMDEMRRLPEDGGLRETSSCGPTGETSSRRLRRDSSLIRRACRTCSTIEAAAPAPSTVL